MLATASNAVKPCMLQSEGCLLHGYPDRKAVQQHLYFPFPFVQLTSRRGEETVVLKTKDYRKKPFQNSTHLRASLSASFPGAVPFVPSLRPNINPRSSATMGSFRRRVLRTIIKMRPNCNLIQLPDLKMSRIPARRRTHWPPYRIVRLNAFGDEMG